MSKLDNPVFDFEYTSLHHTLKVLKKLDPQRASQLNDIPAKIIKENRDIATAFFIHRNFNNSLSSSTFPTALIFADAKPVFKKRWHN